MWEVLLGHTHRERCAIALDDLQTRVADLKEIVRKFSAERDWDQFHKAKDLAVGIVTEASELLEIFRFKSENEVEAMLKSPKSAKKIKDELADVFLFRPPVCAEI